MGLSYADLEQLLSLRDRGTSYERTLTVGRQNLYVHPQERDDLVRRFRLGPVFERETRAFGGFGDDALCEALGIHRLDTMDASRYEGASFIHDLNQPVGPEFEQRFDAVIDGGTLEHVFDVSTALANLMRMARIGGVVYLANPANNLCGHGFYQFSPELMFRVFREQTGFEVERVAMVGFTFPVVELTHRRSVVDVVDPEVVRSRVNRMSLGPVVLTVTARKVRHMNDPFVVPPQQSDYTTRWTEGQAHGAEDGQGRFRSLPGPLRNRLMGAREVYRASRFNRRVYRPPGRED